ncbi:MAG: IPT/TIG domain-containing protein [Dehalococcoidia bacterium]
MRRTIALITALTAVFALAYGSDWRSPSTASAQTPPAVTSITPNAGPDTGGTTVTITGSGFSTTPGATQFGETASGGFRFNSVSCTSSTQCTAVSPANPQGAGGAESINVFAIVNGQASSGNPDHAFGWFGRPLLTSISPTTGPTTGGTHVTLSGRTFPSGSFFPGTATVMFGTRPALDVRCTTIVSCTAVAPPGSGTVPVTITTPGGTSAGISFTYSPSRPQTGPGLPVIPIHPAFPDIREIPPQMVFPTIDLR